MNKMTIRDLDVKGKKVLMRVDFNVPVKDGVVGDDTRITAALPSINYVLENGGSLILMSHCGRPKGEKNMEFTLKPAADRLAELVDAKVTLAPDVIGPEVKTLVDAIQPGEIVVLENVRFYKEEEGKGCTPEEQDAFAKELASYGDVYVSDAFGTAHRAHASMAVVTKYIDQCAAGFLLEKEIEYLGKTLEAPEKPFVAIIGGAKISGKIDVVTNLMDKCDAILIGGGMAYTFYKAMGKDIGGSLVEEDKIELAGEILKQAEGKGVKLMLPVDNIVADAFSADANTKTVGDSIEDGWMALDIGPETIKAYCAEVAGAKTVVWNGPMGCFEMAPFANGTFSVCEAVANSDSISIIGGGDSVSAVKKSGVADKMSHVSTGGGASLEFMEGKQLPGIVALTDKA
ncbi:phosphoglycerate kinase [Tichowtungia aerotolerans]|uniref:Phosphoglycerate kinase n=1 Tax=Tichowtungia aerotolerans TaxID=2697043 RepID=A0A6P1M6C0_9BACT|nr:phosphoglycerate kinase [Tichowtungia aerotolerans]QHI69391.1 phosphoglycerate kinase [Tichowtungia aerotolerans]